MLGDICFGPIYGESHFKLLSHIRDTVNRWHELAKLHSHRCNRYVLKLQVYIECLSIMAIIIISIMAIQHWMPALDADPLPL